MADADGRWAPAQLHDDLQGIPRVAVLGYAGAGRRASR
jgi:hypothetical protein